jgi:hypothetical protein
MKSELNKGTIWRDSKGRITRAGSLKAITADTRNGKKWDVSGDTPKLIKIYEK